MQAKESQAQSEFTCPRPSYAENFRCIGPACEDTCCAGWSVPVDEAAWERFRALPSGPLRTLLDASVLVHSGGKNGATSRKTFATMQMTAENRCPLHTGDRLCRIHAELGEEFLPSACAAYPRIVSSFNGLPEAALSLSCPEATRLVLLTPVLLDPAPSQSQPPVAKSTRGENPFLPFLLALRSAAVHLVRNRAYPLWQRIFLLGIFCRRLDAIAAEEEGAHRADKIAAFLEGFAATVGAGGLERELKTVPANHTRQLDMVLRLAGMLLHRSNILPRFVECIEAFTKGIGNGPGATLVSLTANYSAAHDLYYAPFFAGHPQILENYLLNTIFRCQFPVGREGLKPESTPNLAREFALLTSQFALIKGLLIGVAGCHKDRFRADHVVHTVQAASKHFEHHPEFLAQAHSLLTESQMDGALGMAILLRNVETSPLHRSVKEKHLHSPQSNYRLQPGPLAPDSDKLFASEFWTD